MKVGDKLRWLALELLVVFIGVYLAFLFSSYTEQQKVRQERQKVLRSLKREIEEFRISFPLFADYQLERLKEWDEMYEKGEVYPYYSWRYLEPQYNIQVIEYAIELQGTEVIDFELYESILNLHMEIKRLEHAERLMTNISNSYNILPKELSPNSVDYIKLKAENRFHFFKFRSYGRDRHSNLLEVAELASEVVTLVNDRLEEASRIEIELELLEYYYSAEPDSSFIIELFLEKFPNLPADLLQNELKGLMERGSANKP